MGEMGRAATFCGKNARSSGEDGKILPVGRLLRRKNYVTGVAWTSEKAAGRSARFGAILTNFRNNVSSRDRRTLLFLL